MAAALRPLAAARWASLTVASSRIPATAGAQRFRRPQASPWTELGATRGCGEVPAGARSPSALPPPPVPLPSGGRSEGSGETKFYRERLLDGEEEVLTEDEKREKDEIVKELTRRLSGPLADEHGNVPTGKDRPIAIEVDGPSHFYANSKKYTAYTKLKHRLLTRMGYKVLHVPYFDWRKLRGAREREEYMRNKLLEEPTEWLDPEDEKYYNSPPEDDEEEFSVKPEPPATPPPPPGSASPSSPAAASAAAAAASTTRAPPPPPSPPLRPEAAAGEPNLPRSPPPPPPPQASAPVISGLEAGSRRPAGSSPPPPPPPPPRRPSSAPAGEAQGSDADPAGTVRFSPFPPPPPPK